MATAAQHPPCTSGWGVRMLTLLEFIDVAKIWATSNISELLKFSRMNTVKRMPSFWTNYLSGIYFLTIFFSDTNCWSKYEANQKPHGRETWSLRRKYEHYPGRMAQRVSVLRQPSHMANLAQNQNQSCKTIAMAGEDVRVAPVKMTILYHWELSRPDGAEGARQEFHRRKIDFAPILPFQTHLSSSHTTPLVDLHSQIHFLHLCAFDYVGPSV